MSNTYVPSKLEERFSYTDITPCRTGQDFLKKNPNTTPHSKNREEPKLNSCSSDSSFKKIKKELNGETD